MMMKRSSHIPTLTHIATAKSTKMFLRAFRNHRTCGTRTLQRSSDQYWTLYGPESRFWIMNDSYGLPEYQAMNASIP